MKLPIPLRLRKHSANIVVVGAGGTGGYLIPWLVKNLSIINSTNKSTNHSLTIVDGDIVEKKNVARQNFIFQDIGKNKAEVMAERYGSAHGVEVYYNKDYVTSKLKLKNIFQVADKQSSLKGTSTTLPKIPILIGCVDSNDARIIFHELFFEHPTAFIWIDCGNEKTNGQVVLGNKAASSIYTGDVESKLAAYKNFIAKGQQHLASLDFNTPTVTQLHPELLIKQEKKQVSCVDLALVDPQTMRANIGAAVAAFNYVDDILNGREILSHATYFSTNGASRICLNYSDDLIKYN